MAWSKQHKRQHQHQRQRHQQRQRRNMQRQDCRLAHKQAAFAAVQHKLMAHQHPSQVIDLISLKPFDMEAITNSVHKTKRVIIVEECMKTGGIGASLSATINESCFDHLDHQVRRRGCPVASVAAGRVTEGRSVIVLAGIAPCGFRASQSVRNHAD